MTEYSVLRNVLKSLTPPILWEVLRRLRAKEATPVLEYTAEGWRTSLDHDAGGWSGRGVVSAETAKWEAFVRNLEGSSPLGFAHEATNLDDVRNPFFHNVHITFAYVLTLSARKKDAISVLDWGGSLGHYYRLSKAVLPGVAFDYHCKEVPALAAAGRRLNPEVHFCSDKTCLTWTYDLIMLNGSLQYMENWEEILGRSARALKPDGYLFLTRLPVVERVPSFVAVQRAYGSEMLHQQLNQNEVLETARRLGLSVVRELVCGDRPYIKSAPEQCELRGWLFTKGESVQ